MNNIYNDSFIRIPADCLLNMDVVVEVNKPNIFDGSTNAEINEMVKSSDIIDDHKNHPYTRKLIRK